MPGGFFVGGKYFNTLGERQRISVNFRSIPKLLQMKQLVFIVGLMATMHCYAQELFTGIGIFKIDTDTSLVYQFAKSTKIKIKNVNTDYKYLEATTLAHNPTIARLYRNTKEVSTLMKLNNCPNTVEFSISSYEVAGINIKNIRLIYYNNQLTKVNFDYSSEVVEAIETKYGKLNTKITTDSVTCIYNLTGRERKLAESTITQSRDFGLVKIHVMLWVGYDSHCNSTASSMFYYERENKELNICASSNEQPLKPKIDKDKLKDF